MPASSLLRPVVEALAYTRRFPTLAVIVLLAAAPGAIGLAYVYLLPTAAAELGIGAEGLGNLIAATGIGGLIAGLFLDRSSGAGATAAPSSSASGWRP